MTTFGIIGAGNIGRAIATALARHDISVVLSNSRGPESLAETVAAIGPSVSAGTRERAASQDIVFVAVNWSKLPRALAGLPNWNGRIVIDANNPIEAPLFKPAELHGRLSTEIVADLVPGARVVKAFNHLLADLVSRDPRAEGGQRVLFYSGDDAAAKAEVGALIERLGFAGIDLGPVAVGGKLTQFPGGPLPALNLVKFA
ncbi:NADPH-dependent F420 reductase [Rhizobium sophorae]|uniref:NADPH-dependent F420 reductase n=1 Tax=Rhizobium sophorae TaxID=1535242 RepID=A0A7Y3SDG6_9HYPH|nr:NADPH-dependent F420 reductase [Rhizobium sophorae]MBX4859288.1 NADPH-dependent F420 reductase [Rhizobium bangladeshense]NKK70846.1 NADP oxidoreductase [Rhizobium leguminosarum bv. viciae]NKL33254.1 NADP oxidoreductase [Rhizobium leguminosarum bv. viciae]NNU41643.1 NADPH-dependent F420 reductase [Rhizobium sophorae]